MAYELNWVTENLAVGAAPMSHADLDDLHEHGVDAVLNLCSEFCDLHWLESEAGFEVYYLPILDEHAPDMEELEKALDWLDEVIYLGKKALVHCRHGIGRTGTVVSAYLLRKGLNSKQKNKALKGLRSQPANFSQWWFLRKYGKKQTRLTIREPSLENKNAIDLFPFFTEYEELLEQFGTDIADSKCGFEHTSCCFNHVQITLVEAIYLQHAMNTQLGRIERERLTTQAVEAGKALRKIIKDSGATPESSTVRSAYRELSIPCPLLEYGECRLYKARPIACRLAPATDDDITANRPVQQPELLAEGLAKLSDDVFLAYASEFPRIAIRYALADVISGKFVQLFFHQLIMQEG